MTPPSTVSESCESSSSLTASTSSPSTSVSHNAVLKPRRKGSAVSLSELFSKDLYPFYRSNHKSRRKVSRLSPSVEELPDQKILFPPDYAQDQHDHFHLPGSQMLRENTEKNSNRDKFYGFFGRSSSRSRSKKRRSRSADALPVIIIDSSLPTPSSHARHSSLGDKDNVGGKPSILSPSRPLSTATSGTVTQTKTRPKKIPDSLSTAAPPQQTLEPVKPRKKSIFGIPIPNTRKPSGSRSETPKLPPDNHKLDRVLSARSHVTVPEIPMNNSTNLRSTDDIPSYLAHSFDISEPDSGLGLETVTSNTKVFAPLPRPAFAVAPTNLKDFPDVPVRVSSSPPRLEKERRPDILDAKPRRPKAETSSGRSSPLAGLFKGSSSRVASPTSDSGRGGRDSAASIRASISGPKMAKARNKHGSFDFERPTSNSVGSRPSGLRNGLSKMPSATDMGVLRLNNGNGKFSPGHWPAHSTTYVIHEEKKPALSRTRSTKSTKTTGGREVGARILRFEDTPLQFTNGDLHPQGRPPNKDPRARSPLAHSSINTKVIIPKSATPTLPPIDAATSPSGQSSSWGRSAGKALQSSGSNALPAFSFEHASANEKHGLGRSAGKGRSLDLGIELNWAPKRVKEEAVMGGRSKWKEEAEVKELGRKRVADTFEEVLGESGFAKFREYIHRFDARLIPLEGPSGLLYKVHRLLDTTARGLDENAKKELLERFDRVVQHSRP